MESSSRGSRAYNVLHVSVEYKLLYHIFILLGTCYCIYGGRVMLDFFVFFQKKVMLFICSVSLLINYLW